mmetsp:Transcript_13463/g.25897  ORF Transcript_13463/g.25897 Transcript_13463/m.25897 type:complete len:244 (-) Transcript_13463:608-1339(-)
MDGVIEQSRHCPKEGRHDLWKVVEMPRDSPPARCQQERSFHLASGGGVLGCDVLRGLTPNWRASIGGAEGLSLAVRVIVHPDAQQPCNGDGARHRESQLIGVRGQIQHRRRVHARHPHQAAPAYVVSRTVMHDVHAAPVPRLPHEKLADIRQNHNQRRDHAVRDMPVRLLLFRRKAQCQARPRHHSETAVGERLQVERAEARVQLHPPVEVVQQGAARAAVAGARSDVALGQKEEAEPERSQV